MSFIILQAGEVARNWIHGSIERFSIKSLTNSKVTHKITIILADKLKTQ